MSRVLLTGGPTRAYLDDVRYLSNRSSGALALAIATKLSSAGHRVVAVMGPVNFKLPRIKNVKWISVETHDEMRGEVLATCRRWKPHTAVFAAAVLDFAPSKLSKGKTSSSREEWVVRLVPTPKIVDIVGKRFPKIRKIGFKLESKVRRGQALEKFARDYMKRKGLEALVVNFLSEVGAQKHKAHLFTVDGTHRVVKSKGQIAGSLASILYS